MRRPKDPARFSLPYNSIKNIDLKATKVAAKEKRNVKARIFLLVDLQEFFFRFRVGGQKNPLKMTIEWSFSEDFFFLISPEQTVKLVR